MSTPFRNLRVWRLDAPWTKSAEEIDEALQADAFQPCAPGQAESLGWEASAQGAERQAKLRRSAPEIAQAARQVLPTDLF